MHDLVIRGGTVVDGTGSPRRTADVAVDDRRIAAVGQVDARGRREIDADGALVLPGWVDIHTHYDGQATWDPEMAPSSWHGATTVVMGNCGVGFAPVRPGHENFLIELMEGVEDIPGTALHEGIEWGWESFGQYLDALDGMARTVDIGAQVPHAALRAYVMGERAHDDDLTADEIAQVAGLAAQAVEDGALGFSTSRTALHRSRHGLVPGTHAVPDELLAVAEALAATGGAVFQFVSDNAGGGDDRHWLDAIAAHPGLTVTYTLLQAPAERAGVSTVYREALRHAQAAGEQGRRIVPQVPPRPTGMLFGLQSSFHTFISHPTFRQLRDRPLAEKVARLRSPEVRARLLAEQPGSRVASSLAQNWAMIYPLGDPPDYEPHPDTAAGAVAAREGRSPEEVVLDWLLEDDGKAFLFVPFGSYADGDHEAIREMMGHPATVVGLSDGGAHCGLICDASFPTYLLTHWTRDRSRGEHLPLELVVHKQTEATAAVHGLTDRGVLAPGKLADINVVDHDVLRLHPPHMVHDLPAAGRRLVQPVDGYLLTLKSGQVTLEAGTPTGARPGRVVR